MLSSSSAPMSAAILCGGAGSRLWPLSRRESPKQFLPLTGPLSPFQQTLRRMDRFGDAPPLIVCNVSHERLARDQTAALDPPLRRTPHFVLEPTARGTAAAALLAAHAARARYGSRLRVLLTPADHHIVDDDGLAAALDVARATPASTIALFGVKPDFPSSDYGYVTPGDATRCAPIVGFTEKPDAATAAKLIAERGALWNSGMFFFAPETLIAEAQRHCPPIATAVAASLPSPQEADPLRPDATRFAAAPLDSLDYAVMEKTKIGVVIAAEMGWSDIGSWRALHRLAARDADGNACLGPAAALGATNCYLRSDGPPLAVGALRDCAAIVAKGAVLIAPMERLDAVRELAAAAEAKAADSARDAAIDARPDRQDPP